MNSTANDPESIGVDPEGEIKKLQELVKKLEFQNQLLLRQSSQDEKVDGRLQLMPDQFLESGNSEFSHLGQQHNQTTGKLDQSSQVLRQLNGVKTALANSTICTTPEKHNIDKSERSKVEISKLSLESVGLVDIERLSLDVEDSWLYKSPKQTPGTETAKSPFLWVREEFDQPSDDQTASFHRSLYYKLDEVTKTAEPGSQWQQKKPDIKTIGKIETEHDPGFNPDNGDVTEIIGVAPHGKPVESRPLASQAEAPCAKNDTAESNISEKDTLIRPSTLFGKDRRVSESSIADTGYQKVSSASEENLLGVKYRLADVTDVKVLARMQEESLRMSYNSPLGSKKALSKSLNRSSGRLVDSCDSLLDDGGAGYSKGLNQSTGALIETVDYSADTKTRRSTPQKLLNENRSVSKSATSLAVPASHAAARSGLPKAQIASNSLPGTPYGSNQELSKPTLSATSNVVPHRQSMPNLNRNLKFSVLKSHPSDSRLAVTGKKPLSLLRQSSPSPASATTLGRGTRSMAPLKATANVMQRPASRSTNAINSSAVTQVSSLTLKKRPTTLGSTEAKSTRAMTSGSGRTTPGATTPTSKTKPLVMSAKKTTVTTPPRNSGIPKPGSLTKLSIPQKANVQAGRATSTPANDDDDWKEGCF